MMTLFTGSPRCSNQSIRYRQTWEEGVALVVLSEGFRIPAVRVPIVCSSSVSTKKAGSRPAAILGVL